MNSPRPLVDMDMETEPSDWTDSLLERLDAMECPCLPSGCLCSKADYIRERTSPAMEKNRFLELAKRTGLSLAEAREHYVNYQIDVGYAMHREELARLYAEMDEARESLNEKLRNGLSTWPAVKRINEAARRSHELRKRIYAPVLNGSR